VALIEIHGLTKLYRMGTAVVHALDGVNLAIERGDFVAITGASGSGKSTMMHLLGCLDRPTAGHYLLDGHDVSDLSDAELAAIRNQQIGFVFQTFNLINRTSALENVSVPLFYARRTNTRGPSVRALERVGLTSRSHHNPNELSGGERQRVAIARAIVNDPPLLLADEPTGNLDSRTGEQIMDIFRQLNEQGVTIVMVTHEPDIARQARRIVQMRDGQIVSDRLTADILAAEGQSGPRKWTSHAPTAGTQVSTAEPEPAAAPSAAKLAMAEPAKLMRGATAGLVCGIVATVLWVLLGTAQYTIGKQFTPSEPITNPKQLSVGMIVFFVSSCLTMVIAFALGIIAILWSRSARNKMRKEPGNWLGWRRTMWGLVLGSLCVAFPVVMIVVGLVWKYLHPSP
jgi:putative ABC transport system ATP-binding protein